MSESTASITELHGRINGMSASIGQLREAVTVLAERVEKLEQGGGIGGIEGLGVTFTVTPWPWFGNDD